MPIVAMFGKILYENVIISSLENPYSFVSILIYQVAGKLNSVGAFFPECIDTDSKSDCFNKNRMFYD